MDRYRKALAGLLSPATGLAADELEPLVVIPEPGHGELSLACFELAKRLRKPPAKVAKDLEAVWPGDPRFQSVRAEGPYVNARIEPSIFMRDIVGDLLSKGQAYLENDAGRGRTVVIDFSSPNIAKPLAYHHLRSTVIGRALGNLLRASGYQVEGVNFLGDWGKTFGLLIAKLYDDFHGKGISMAGLSRHAIIEKLESLGGMGYLLDLYVSANKEAEEDAGFDAEARKSFVGMEQEDPQTVEIWAAIRELSLAEFDRVYRRLGVAFEHVEGESLYRDKLEAAIDEIRKRPGVRESEGALVVDLPYAEDEPPCMLRKADGATLYLTRDIAAALDRWERFRFDRALYVVATDQSLHFKQLKRVLAAMGREWADRIIHVHFGRVHGMSTRKGNVLFLEDVLDEGKRLAGQTIQESSPDLENADEVAEQVCQGALVFADLRNQRGQDYKFDWKEQLNFKGFTGAGIQYAHARCCSVLRKSGLPLEGPQGPDLGSVDFSLLGHEAEAALVRSLSLLPAAVQSAALEHEPYRLARALFEIAKGWHHYQQAGTSDRSLRILADDRKIRAARLALVEAVRRGLMAGMDLLGMPHPATM